MFMNMSCMSPPSPVLFIVLISIDLSIRVLSTRENGEGWAGGVEGRKKK